MVFDWGVGGGGGVLNPALSCTHCLHIPLMFYIIFFPADDTAESSDEEETDGKYFNISGTVIWLITSGLTYFKSSQSSQLTHTHFIESCYVAKALNFSRCA